MALHIYSFTHFEKNSDNKEMVIDENQNKAFKTPINKKQNDKYVTNIYNRTRASNL